MRAALRRGTTSTRCGACARPSIRTASAIPASCSRRRASAPSRIPRRAATTACPSRDATERVERAARATLGGALALEPHAPVSVDGVPVGCTLRPRDGEALARAPARARPSAGSRWCRSAAATHVSSSATRRARVDALLSTRSPRGHRRARRRPRASPRRRRHARSARCARARRPRAGSCRSMRRTPAQRSAARSPRPRIGPRSRATAPPRDVLLGLEVVLGSGERTRCGGRVVKNVTGYDLVRLYTGSFGHARRDRGARGCGCARGPARERCCCALPRAAGGRRRSRAARARRASPSARACALHGRARRSDALAAWSSSPGATRDAGARRRVARARARRARGRRRRRSTRVRAAQRAAPLRGAAALPHRGAAGAARAGVLRALGAASAALVVTRVCACSMRASTAAVAARGRRRRRRAAAARRGGQLRAARRRRRRQARARRLRRARRELAADARAEGALRSARRARARAASRGACESSGARRTPPRARGLRGDLRARRSTACTAGCACRSARPTGRPGASSSPRGRIYLMRGVAEGGSRSATCVAEEAYLCLGCRACETACPAGVRYGTCSSGCAREIERAGLRRGPARRARAPRAAPRACRTARRLRAACPRSALAQRLRPRPAGGAPAAALRCATRRALLPRGAAAPRARAAAGARARAGRAARPRRLLRRLRDAGALRARRTPRPCACSRANGFEVVDPARAGLLRRAARARGRRRTAHALARREPARLRAAERSTR